MCVCMSVPFVCRIWGGFVFGATFWTDVQELLYTELGVEKHRLLEGRGDLVEASLLYGGWSVTGTGVVI